MRLGGVFLKKKSILPLVVLTSFFFNQGKERGYTNTKYNPNREQPQWVPWSWLVHAYTWFKK
jgi:hypothetical protein